MQFIKASPNTEDQLFNAVKAKNPSTLSQILAERVD